MVPRRIRVSVAMAWTEKREAAAAAVF